MSVIRKAHSRNAAFISHAEKAPLSPAVQQAVSEPSYSAFGLPRRENYSAYYRHFRGWAYAAINALASEAASQPIMAGRKYDQPITERDITTIAHKAWSNMPQRVKSHFGQVGEIEVLPSHAALTALETPNEIQRRWQFVYMFVANLCLTGWGYIVGGEDENGETKLYAVPTSWITPVHKDGPFSAFLLKNPDNPEMEAVPLTREHVAFAHLPNPANPLGATSPVGAQIQAIRVDDHIQTSQERFFQNGIFPASVVTIGKDPHPDIMTDGMRPRLTPEQRRQVTAAIKKVLGGVANMGNPAIIDGLIEDIKPISFSQKEMGWEKSEDKVRVRILSAYGVHPYILGEPINIGGYAQAAKIEERFCKRVNVVLDMLSALTSSFAVPLVGDTSIVLWWEECKPYDPNIHWQNVRKGRDMGDVTRNEFRAMLGLSDSIPDEAEHRARLLDQAGGANFILQIMDRVGNGAISPEAATHAVSLVMEITTEEAAIVVGRAMENNNGNTSS